MAGFSFLPATRTVFRNQVVDLLRAAIADGRLRTGEAIREREIADRMYIAAHILEVARIISAAWHARPYRIVDAH